jgi:hypothetical protein
VADDRAEAMAPRELHRLIRIQFAASYVVVERIRSPHLLELLDTLEGQ